MAGSDVRNLPARSEIQDLAGSQTGLANLNENAESVGKKNPLNKLELLESGQIRKINLPRLGHRKKSKNHTFRLLFQFSKFNIQENRSCIGKTVVVPDKVDC